MSGIKWGDSEDVYKPINRRLRDFLQERKRFSESNLKTLKSLYRDLSANEMSIFVVYSAEESLKQHLSIDPNNETGGVLVGQAYFCPEIESHYTEILGSIPALHTIGNRVHFRFTLECWQDILSTQKQKFPDTTIIGWYHSHPDHGIFLSGTDLNTQRLSFKQIWQIATVYDPIRKEIGYFYGADGKKAKHIYVEEKLSDTRKATNSELQVTPQSEHSQDNNINTIPQDSRSEDIENICIELKKIWNELIIFFSILNFRKKK